MKKFPLLPVALMSILFISCEEDSQANKTVTNSQAALETPKGRQSYAVGANFGKFLSNDLRQVEVDLDYSMILQGIKDQLDIKQDSTKQALMNDSAIMAALQELTVEMRNAQIAKDSILRIENLAKQNAFLEKNKGDTGVITTASGLQYKILAAGKGNLAKDGDTVSVHYTGTLLDGTEFDSSIRRNQPLSIPLAEGQLISGWVEMLRLMKVSDKVKAWIPSHLAYGEQGNRGIPGNSMLIFEMELLDIKAAKK